MYTVDNALEALRKYDVSEADLREWEQALGLEISVDDYNRKQYSPHHINLFKNVKKHLALGRTLDEIRQIISLPPLEDSRPKATPIAAGIATASQPVETIAPQQAVEEKIPALAMAAAETPQPANPVPPPPIIPSNIAAMENARTEQRQIPEAPAKVITKSPYASAPKRPATSNGSGNAAQVVSLVQRLTREKDQLYKKLLETEKLNSHLYSANTLFHKKVRDMNTQIGQLRESLKEEENFKLLDDKARLHKQLLTAEKLIQHKEDQIQQQNQIMNSAQSHIRDLEGRIANLKSAFNPALFRGDWLESGRLVEVLYDNFGINIEADRVRLFRISEMPERIYGRTAIIPTSYQYETNNLWKRNETLTVTYTDQHTLDGELIAEYILDGVPVAKALYRVTCQRNQ